MQSIQMKQDELIQQAAEIINQGGVVAFPTETVYGLGADAFNADAVKQIFVAKGRPLDNPIIVHIASLADLDNLTKDIPEKARQLMDKFWPGPLTIVLKRKPIVPSTLTGGNKSIGLRVPKHAVPLAICNASGLPLTATSANKHGGSDADNIGHALNQLKEGIDLFLAPPRSFP